MANAVSLGDHQVILSRMDKIAGSNLKVPIPFKGATSLSVFKKCVQDGRKLLPLRYQKAYVDVLEQAVVQAEISLTGTGPRQTAKRRAIFQQLELVFTALGAPIVQLASVEHQDELRAFMAVTSDVYRHFVDNRKIRGAAKSTLLWASLDPLGSFSADNLSSPYTFAASAEMPVALISKPIKHTQYLPLWLIDGHEVGGHSIFTGVDGFLVQLGDAVETRIRDAFKSGAVQTSTNAVQFTAATGALFDNRSTVPMVDFMARLWHFWLHEASADAAGLLNMGPMFANGLILTLANESPTLTLRTRSVFDGRRGFSEHPTDIVRAFLCIAMLEKLGSPRTSAHANALRARLSEIQGVLPETISWMTRSGAQAVEVRLTDLQAVLPVVADAILNSQLAALSGNSLNSVIPWTSVDERAARHAAASLLKGDIEVKIGVEARHIVAGSMLATESASEFDDFELVVARIHDTGIEILCDMYANQCLLCNVQTLKGAARESADVKLIDLVRLVKSMRESQMQGPGARQQFTTARSATVKKRDASRLRRSISS